MPTNPYLPPNYDDIAPYSDAELEAREDDAPEQQSGLLRALNVLDWPGRIGRSLLHGDPANAVKSVFSPFGGGVKAYSFVDDFTPSMGGVGGFAAGMALDLVTDPLFALGVGGPLSRAAARAGKLGGKAIVPSLMKQRAGGVSREALEAGVEAINPSAKNLWEQGVVKDFSKSHGPATTAEGVHGIAEGYRTVMAAHPLPYSWLLKPLFGIEAPVVGFNLGLDKMGRLLDQMGGGAVDDLMEKGAGAGRFLHSFFHGPEVLKDLGYKTSKADTVLHAASLPYRGLRRAFSAIPGVGTVEDEKMLEYAGEAGAAQMLNATQRGMPTLARLSGDAQYLFDTIHSARRHTVESAAAAYETLRYGQHLLDDLLTDTVSGPMEAGSLHEGIRNKAYWQAFYEKFGAMGSNMEELRAASPDLFKGYTSRLEIVQDLRNGKLNANEVGHAMKLQDEMEAQLLKDLEAMGADPNTLTQAMQMPGGAGPGQAGPPMPVPPGPKVKGASPIPGMAMMDDQWGTLRDANKLAGADNRVIAQIMGLATDIGIMADDVQAIPRRALEEMGYGVTELADAEAHIHRQSWKSNPNLSDKLIESRSNMRRKDHLRNFVIPTQHILGPGASGGVTHGTAALNHVFKKYTSYDWLGEVDRFAAITPKNRDLTAIPAMSVAEYTGAANNISPDVPMPKGKVVLRRATDRGTYLAHHLETGLVDEVHPSQLSHWYDTGTLSQSAKKEFAQWRDIGIARGGKGDWDLLDEEAVMKQISRAGGKYVLPKAKKEAVEAAWLAENPGDAIGAQQAVSNETHRYNWGTLNAKGQRVGGQLRELANHIMGLKGEDAREVVMNGMFGNDFLVDQLTAATALMRQASGLRNVLHMVAHTASANADEGGVPLEAFLKGNREQKLGLGLNVGENAARGTRGATNYVTELMEELANGKTGASGTHIIPPNPVVRDNLDLARKADAANPTKTTSRLGGSLYVPPRMASLALNLMEFQADPKKVSNWIGEIVDWTGRLFKQVQYGVFGASHNRNEISGHLQNILSHPQGIIQGFKNHFRNTKIVHNWVREAKNGNVQPLPAGVLPDAVGFALGNRLVAHGKMGEVLSHGAQARGLATGVPVAGQAESMLDKIIGVRIGGHQYGPVAFGSESMREARDAHKLGIGAPSPAAMVTGGRTAPEVSQFQKGMSGLRGAHRGLELSAATRGNEVEFINRVTGLLNHLDAGWEPMEALRAVKAAHFDYSELSSTDKALRRYLPFYSWVRKNVPALMRDMSNPVSGKAMAIRTAGAIHRASAGSGDMPDYLQESTSIPMPFGEEGEGSATVLNTKGLFPWEDLHFFSGNSKTDMGIGPFTLPGANSRTLEKMSGMLHPIALSLVQAMTGKEMWSGRPLADRPQFPLQESPQINQIMSNFVGRPMGVIRDVSKAAAKLGHGSVAEGAAASGQVLLKSLIGGARLATYYPQEEKLRQQRQEMEAGLEQSPFVGHVESPFIKRREDEEVPVEVERMLKTIGRLTVAQKKERVRRLMRQGVMPK